MSRIQLAQHSSKAVTWMIVRQEAEQSQQKPPNVKTVKEGNIVRRA